LLKIPTFAFLGPGFVVLEKEFGKSSHWKYQESDFCFIFGGLLQKPEEKL
jgi:hypothetical protein